ncbi:MULTISPECIES: CHASE2 domain-containing protein [unclassified Treponema]|uniref:CHASE2 domain-containing protein n=1 Tax=unclassified Treponema TaxID=2638727 RepID=UPI0020A4FB78|nr:MULTISPECIES: adenylate/guanylate cyclase domain-containing protein [unclassified Treponema]UTC66920.1 adenylate/guanylate cyclase domain-containing protein [Treponema sp. OMZ 789]UTC69649.1 adenylate/guanylate cyclase domain-containing protein [Treponema sp. OMZ 790]UTC72363.1 adenylate/guanylate cyclase domain-containing protein [Treponema sp. OMZ 791]
MKKIRRLFFISVSVFFIVSFFIYLGVFRQAEYFFYDDRMKNTASYFSSSDEIVLVLVDQKSLTYAASERGWKWPWPREAYAEITDFFSRGGAKSVAFDMLFTEPSSYGEADDKKFADSSKESGIVIQTVFFDRRQRIFPIDEIASSAKLIGNVNSLPDSDGTIRRARLFYSWKDYKIPTLGIASYFVGGNEDEGLPAELNLRFTKSIDDYLPYSAGDILKAQADIRAGRESELHPEDFEDMYVFFGLYAPGLFDICQTPVSASYPGVGIHITLLDNILSGNRIVKTGFLINALIILICIILSGLPEIFSEKIKLRAVSLTVNAASFLCFAVFYIFISYLLFRFGISVPTASVLAGMVLSFVSSLAVSYMVEGKQRRYLKNAFKQYLSPAVIEELIADPSQLKLGGERKEISIFFSDLQGFTSISESLSPEALTELLNDYLSDMSKIILDSGGTIDKYEGDAIIAFWNAPARVEHHARSALEAAWACQKKLEERRAEFEKRAEGRPFKMRIGLNTGFAIVGNMGSVSRFDYTMLGDSVNLAARLEGLNKQFSTYTMCAEAAKKQAEESGTGLKFRELARAAVVGKSEPVVVYEIMDEKTYNGKKALLDSFDKGLKEFYAGNFKEALNIFAQNEEADPPSKHYAEKCKLLISQKPEGEWRGIWKADTK